jgi:hypothetical protein
MSEESNGIEHGEMFGAALRSLESSGQFTPEEQEAIAAAIEVGIDSFRQQMPNRVAELGERSRRKSMLQAIADMQKRLAGSQVVDDVRLARSLSRDLTEIQDELARLAKDGCITLTKISDSLAVVITDHGYSVIEGE